MFDQHVIETPENISFDYQVAGIGSRFLAVIVDTLIQGTLYLFIVVVFVLVEAVLGTATEANPIFVPQWIPGIILIVTLFVIQFGYFIIFEITLGGRTPGKELAGLRVIKENGQPLTALDSIIRNLVRIIDFLPFGYGVGVITMFFNARAKRLGDFAAGTLVVWRRAVERRARRARPGPRGARAAAGGGRGKPAPSRPPSRRGRPSSSGRTRAAPPPPRPVAPPCTSRAWPPAPGTSGPGASSRR